MHKLLLRQLKRCGVTPDQLPEDMRIVLAAVSEAYEQSDHDRKLLEQSLELTSHELLEANAELRRDRADLERAVRERTMELEREITERRQAEVAIRSSEARFRRLFEGSRDAIYISTPEGRLVDINAAGVKLFGYDTRDEMMSLDIPRQLYVQAAQREEFRAAMASDGFVRDMEVSVQRRDGRILTVQISASAERNESGHISSYRGILRDVTARRELEASLHRAQRMESIGRVAGGVAHDFNNLLTAILGYADLCDRQVADDTPTHDHLQEIMSAATRGAQLTTQLLAFSRRQVLSPRVLDLNAIVTDMQRLLDRVIGEDVELLFELSDDRVRVRADGSQLEQVLLNLVVNARDAMPNGGQIRIRTRSVALQRELTCRRLDLEPGIYVVLETRDGGVGMNAEVRERVFEPFFTTKPQGKGTGLGLSTVYGIVEQSGGRIDLQSSPGQGSTFTVYLPATDEPLDVHGVEENESLLATRADTILVVEDEDSVRSLLCDVLTEAGFRVLQARDGQDGYTVLEDRKGAIDLLLSDVVMPRMSGAELIHRARKHWPALPILLISGYTEKPDALLRGGVAGPPVHFLQKPFTPATLLARLRAILEHQEEAESPA